MTEDSQWAQVANIQCQLSGIDAALVSVEVDVAVRAKLVLEVLCAVSGVSTEKAPIKSTTTKFAKVQEESPWRAASNRQSYHLLAKSMLKYNWQFFLCIISPCWFSPRFWLKKSPLLIQVWSVAAKRSRPWFSGPTRWFAKFAKWRSKAGQLRIPTGWIISG